MGYLKIHTWQILFFFCFAVTQAQVTTKLSTQKIKIGEPIVLKISIEKNRKDSISVSPLDSIPNFEILSIDDKKESGLAIKEITFTSFDEGNYELPSFQVAINQNIYNTPTQKIVVENVKVDPSKQGLYNIKTIMPVSYSLWDYVQKNWILFALLYLLAVVGFIIYLLYKKEKEIDQQIYKDLISPYDEAKFSLEKLIKNRIIEKEDAKDLYVSLSFIIKRFIGRKYRINYAERLTDEFIDEIIQNKILPDDEIQMLSDFLSFADLVKFAKYQPKNEAKENNFKQISTLIERHKPLYNANQEENV